MRKLLGPQSEVYKAFNFNFCFPAEAGSICSEVQCFSLVVLLHCPHCCIFPAHDGDYVNQAPLIFWGSLAFKNYKYFYFSQ